MKQPLILISGLFTLVICTSALGQVSNLQVNGSSSSFAMTSGDSITWTYHVSPAGSTALIEIWYDANNNGTIDPSSDVLWQSFPQTDGDTLGSYGPSDADGLVNGVVSLSKSSIGLPPGKYILQFSQGGTSLTVTGTVSALSSPAHTISGTVTVPSGKSALNIFVGADATGGHKSGPGWWALTNASGNYQIAMGSDTSGGPWQVYMRNNPFPPDIITPPSQLIYITGNPAGLNFSIASAAAQIAGTVKDQNGNLIPSAVVVVASSNFGEITYVQTNYNGVYQAGLTQANLNGNTGFAVVGYFEQNQGTVNTLDAMAQTGTVSPGDSVSRNLIAYTANSTISGSVTVNGAIPNYPLQLAASNIDSCQSVIYMDPSTGNFSFPVTNKVFNYNIYAYNTPIQTTGSQVAHPGQSGLVVSLTTTGVSELTNSTPHTWSLGQNYPNPFNPATVISYQIPVNTYVTLKVYDMLGREVKTLVNERQTAGTHLVTFDAGNLASGVYFYRMQAGSFVQTKKLILMK